MQNMELEWIVSNDGKMPDWLKVEARNGLVKKLYDDDEFVGVKVFSPGKMYEAHVGDIVTKNKHGLSVTPVFDF